MVAATLRHSLARAALALSALLVGAPAQAQSDPAAGYPDRPIRLVVPFAAGGGNDIFARVVGAKASEILGQQLFIENRPAAGGRVAADFVIRQPADGYTLFVGASGVMSIAAAIYPNLGYHPTKNFVPLAMIASFPLILTVPPSSPVKTVADLVAYGKAHPEKSNFAHTSAAFLIPAEILKLGSGMPATGIPVKSSAEMVQCVMQEVCSFTFTDGPPAIPQIKDNRLRALAVTGSERSPELPDAPSMVEAGFPDVNVKIWAGVFAPVGTPPAIVKKLEVALQAAIKDPDVSAKLRGMAVNPGRISAEEFRKIIDTDIEAYKKVVKDANLTFE
jgi:tripartite-type tricarboxylate transporter receptor subunit TctC